MSRRKGRGRVPNWNNSRSNPSRRHNFNYGTRQKIKSTTELNNEAEREARASNAIVDAIQSDSMDSFAANSRIMGAGAGSVQDRGIAHNISAAGHPSYYTSNLQFQQYTVMYETCWMAQKIVNLPVEDALIHKPKLVNVDPKVEEKVWKRWEELDLDEKFRRFLISGRLYGSSVLYTVLQGDRHEQTAHAINRSNVRSGDLLGFNVLEPIHAFETNHLVWEPDYQQIKVVKIQGMRIHPSRCVIYNNTPLTLLFKPLRSWLRGHSCLAPLWHDIIRAIGSTQGAYHLLHLASCIVASYKPMRGTYGTRGASGAKAAVEHVTNMMSIYRAVVLEGDDAKLDKSSASFGSVPELLSKFLEILAAGADIPITRYLGQSPKGLTGGETELKTYYNNIYKWCQRYVEPRERALLEWVYFDITGEWKDIVLQRPKPQELSPTEQAAVDSAVASNYSGLATANIIDRTTAVAEMQHRGLFLTEPIIPPMPEEPEEDESKSSDSSSSK